MIIPTQKASSKILLLRETFRVYVCYRRLLLSIGSSHTFKLHACKHADDSKATRTLFGPMISNRPAALGRYSFQNRHCGSLAKEIPQKVPRKTLILAMGCRISRRFVETGCSQDGCGDFSVPRMLSVFAVHLNPYGCTPTQIALICTRIDVAVDLCLLHCDVLTVRVDFRTHGPVAYISVL